MFISIIIPAFNVEKTILKCINSVKNQKYKKKEIIVVDDGSIDSTKNILKDQNGIITIFQKNMGPGAARNKGANIAKGDLLLFLDSDCLINDIYFLDKIILKFKDKTIIAVGSGYKKTLGNRFLEQFGLLEHRFKLLNIPKQVTTTSSNCICCRSLNFKKIKGFPINKKFIYAEDILFCYKLSKSGKIFHCDFNISHGFRKTIKTYFKQNKGYAKSNIFLFFTYPNLLFNVTHHSSNIYMQIIFIFFLLVNLALSLFNSVFFYVSIFIILLILYMNINLFYYIKKRKNTIFLIKSIPIIFLRNFSFFYGIIEGLIGLIFSFIDIKYL
jgi:glycosyltransferase involved in cell wall biosynthesis